MTLRAEISGQVLDKVTEMVVDPYTTRNPFAYVQTGLSIVTLGVAEEGMFTAARAAGTAAYAGAMALHSLGRDQYSKHGTLLA
jgi:hypothetical protein